MPDPDHGDHWDFLAADLGASPAPEETREPEQEKLVADDTEVSPTDEATPPVDEGADLVPDDDTPDEPTEKPKKRGGRRGDRVVSGFGYRRGSVDWANLARELGVEALEEVPAPIPASDTEAELVSSVSEEPETVEVVEEVVEIEIETASHAPRDDEPHEAGFGIGILDESEVEAASRELESDEEQPEGQEERKGRRRRRRRKPRKSEVGEEQAPAADAVEEATEAESSKEDGEDDGSADRPRRRGRRRGGRKRESREDVSAEKTEEFGAGVSVEVVDEDGLDEIEVFEEEADSEEGSSTRRPRRGDRSKDRDQEKKTKKVAHRGIPCWEEAVGHIIDTNMESRSKRPEPTGPRQRSGRRRGGDRSSNRGRS